MDCSIPSTFSLIFNIYLLAKFLLKKLFCTPSSKVPVAGQTITQTKQNLLETSLEYARLMPSSLNCDFRFILSNTEPNSKISTTGCGPVGHWLNRLDYLLSPLSRLNLVYLGSLYKGRPPNFGLFRSPSPLVRFHPQVFLTVTIQSPRQTDDFHKLSSVKTLEIISFS